VNPASTPGKYRVIFQGIEGDGEAFKTQMVRLGAPPTIVDKMIRDAPIILRGDLPPGTAKTYANAVKKAGGRVIIQEYEHTAKSNRVENPISIASLEDFTRCPECGLRQPKVEFCVKCGFRFKNS